ncbi:MAG: carboxypeptidase-like regulatory domain-containing protein [Bryobacteraceae bacterium]|nr:carboxypeptidase-like regulatory domain-containing protein [Bryobacteraceae bacterium]MDW8377216.1 carboxypeptidase-like regulatory domain-containing protein [Bryobacterales bacterium]
MPAKLTSLIRLASLALVSAPFAIPAPPPGQTSLTGSIAGVVRNAIGVPQMGATVTLFNRLERQVAKTLTSDQGTFQFDSLPADMYTVRVTLASFLPAVRSNIAVQPGIRQILSIQVAAMISSIELVYSLPIDKAMMSDDWKWTLRGSLATRPILRILGASGKEDLWTWAKSGRGKFSQTRGAVLLSGGDAAVMPNLGSQPDLGTAFALATSFLGTNHLEVSGNVGYGAQTGVPSTGFRTAFSRSQGDSRSPELAITLRQISLSGRAGVGLLTGQSGAAPVLRTLSVGISDRLQLGDKTLLTYGSTLESVSFLERLNYVSPFARLQHRLERWGTFELGYSSGLPASELYRKANGDESSNLTDASSWASFPRVSLRDGDTRIQRAVNFELSYSKKLDGKKIMAAAYHESVNNAALLATSADGALQGSNLLPDLFSTASIFNGGRYKTLGFMAAFEQELSDKWSFTLAYANSGVLEASRDQLNSNDASELRNVLHTRQRHSAIVRLAAVLPASGTKISSHYHFMNGRSLTPGHFYMTQSLNLSQGWNFQVRQPLPSVSGMPGKIELTADIRNILAQGYQPVTLGNGRRVQLVHTPRALRGGLAFIF